MRNYTLKRDSDFRLTVRRGIHFSGEIATAKLFIKRSGSSRIGVVARKTLAGAVQRNRIRRIFVEAFLSAKADLIPPVDLVVFPKQSAIEATYRDALDFLKRIQVSIRSKK